MTHYFDEQPAVASDVAVVDVALPDVAFTMTTDRGVFSHGHLDTGTSLLLRAAPAPSPSGDVLDLGCGSGAIALTMALRSPQARAWAVDVNARALELTAANAARNGVTIRTALPDAVPEDVRFATIWSNPPIRIGKSQLQRLLLRWLERATSSLPVPVSRVIKTVVSAWATCLMAPNTSADGAGRSQAHVGVEHEHEHDIVDLQHYAECAWKHLQRLQRRKNPSNPKG